MLTKHGLFFEWGPDTMTSSPMPNSIVINRIGLKPDSQTNYVGDECLKPDSQTNYVRDECLTIHSCEINMPVQV